MYTNFSGGGASIHASRRVVLLSLLLSLVSAGFATFLLFENRRLNELIAGLKIHGASRPTWSENSLNDTGIFGIWRASGGIISPTDRFLWGVEITRRDPNDLASRDDFHYIWMEGKPESLIDGYVAFELFPHDEYRIFQIEDTQYLIQNSARDRDTITIQLNTDSSRISLHNRLGHWSLDRVDIPGERRRIADEHEKRRALRSERGEAHLGGNQTALSAGIY